MRSRETGSGRLRRTPRTIVTAVAVAVTAAAVSAAALAGDDISADGDAVAAGLNDPVALGTVAPGATVSRTVRFTLECKTKQHVDAGDTVSLTYSASASSIPVGGSVSAGGGSILPPSDWPKDDSPCASSGQTVSSGGAGTGSDGSVTLTAPSAPGNYSYVVQYDIGGTGQTNDVSGSNVKITYTLTVADATPPSITPSVSGTLGANGWYVGNVAVAWTVADPQSPVSSQTGCGPSNVVADTSGATFTCSATSAGGTATNSVTIKRDATIPTVALDAGLPTTTTTGSLLVTGTAADLTSGVASVAVNGQDAAFAALSGTFSRIVTLACGANVISAVSTDNAGNTSAAVTRTVDYVCDSTPPSITPTVSGTLGDDGWYTSDVGVAWTVVDAESPVSSRTGCDSSSVVSDTAGVTFTCSATSTGGTATESVTVKRDATAPEASASAVSGGAAYLAGAWTRDDVVVSYVCADAMSGVAVADGDDDDTVSDESASGSASGSCLDEAGNSASVTFSPIRIDKTAPSASASATSGGAEYLAGTWTRDDVVVSYACSDELSGVASTPADETLAAETASGSASGTCLDEAGNSATASFAPVRIDKTAPSVEFTGAAPAANAAGWHRADVTATFTATDALSGFAPSGLSRSADVVSSGEGDPVVVESPAFTDLAGNTAAPGAATREFRIDKTAPSIEASAVSGGNPYAPGTWTNDDVVVSYACSDALSGVAATADDDDDTVSAESASGSASGTCLDEAGNGAATSFAPIKIDKTAPSISASAVSGGGPYSAGTWTNEDVVVSYACSDALSGVAGGPDDDDDTVGEESASGSASGACVDEAGNSASASFAPIKIDKTDPSIGASAVSGGSPYTAGSWTNEDVVVSYACSDALSGVASTPGEDTVSEESASGSATGSCLDEAGNSATASFAPIRIDKTAPAISASAVSGGNPYSAGTWTNEDVVVSYACSDALSGVAATADDETVSDESASGSASGSCLDEAGNSATASLAPIKIDKTAPSLEFAGQSPAKNAHGWNRVTVTLTWSCADELSGAVSSTASQTIATEGEDQQATGTCSDLAGNSASATDGDVDIDKTKPTLGITGAPGGTAFVVCALPARPGFAPADGLSGLDGSQGDAWTSPATPSGVGTYTYEAHATDRAGNAAVETRSYAATYGSAAVAQTPFLQPVNKEGTSRFKLGSTIPVKFQAVCNGIPVATVAARLFVKQGDSQPDPGVDEAFSTSAATTGNLFRWSDGQYIFNLSTKLGHGNPDGSSVAAFSPGTWTLKAGLDDGTWRSVNVQLVK